MNKFIFTLLLSCISIFTFAQTTLITGKIVIDDGVFGQDVVNNVYVLNLNTNAKTFTNDNGMFSIKVSAGDELSFRHDFYKERNIKISDEMLTKGFVTIHLNIDVIELSEAKINTLNKDYKRNIKLKYDNVDELYKNLNLGIDPNLRFRKIDPYASSMMGSVGILNPATWISVISGQKKKEKKQQEYFKKTDKIKYIENYFTTIYFVESLNIPENKVNDFVSYCYSNFEIDKLVKQKKYDKITEILENEAPIYLSKITSNE